MAKSNIEGSVISSETRFSAFSKELVFSSLKELRHNILNRFSRRIKLPINRIGT